MAKHSKETLKDNPGFTRRGEPLGKLSTTRRIKRWVIGKPKLAASIPSDPTSPKIEKLNIPAIIFRLFLLALAMTVIVSIVMWIILSLTIMPTIKAGSSHYVVNRISWTQGEAPKNTYVMISSKPVDRSFLSRALTMINSDPDGKNSVVIVKGKNNAGQYIAECYTGYCKTNRFVIKDPHITLNVPTENALGEVEKQITITGFKSLPPAE